MSSECGGQAAWVPSRPLHFCCEWLWPTPVGTPHGFLCCNVGRRNTFTVAATHGVTVESKGKGYKHQHGVRCLVGVHEIIALASIALCQVLKAAPPSVLYLWFGDLTHMRTADSRAHLHKFGAVDLSLSVSPRGSWWVYSHFALHQEAYYITRGFAAAFFFFSNRHSIASLNRDLFSYTFCPSGWLFNGFLT